MKEDKQQLQHSQYSRRGLISPLEPSIVHAPGFSRCPMKDCDERGMYTNCYIQSNYKKCMIYLESEEFGR